MHFNLLFKWFLFVSRVYRLQECVLILAWFQGVFFFGAQDSTSVFGRRAHFGYAISIFYMKIRKYSCGNCNLQRSKLVGSDASVRLARPQKWIGGKFFRPEIRSIGIILRHEAKSTVVVVFRPLLPVQRSIHSQPISGVNLSIVPEVKPFFLAKKTDWLPPCRAD